jgi:hypothetical protein
VEGVISLKLAVEIAILLHLLILLAPILFSRNVYNYVMLRSDRLGARREPVRFDARRLPDDPLVRHIGYQD